MCPLGEGCRGHHLPHGGQARGGGEEVTGTIQYVKLYIRTTIYRSSQCYGTGAGGAEITLRIRIPNRNYLFHKFDSTQDR